MDQSSGYEVQPYLRSRNASLDFVELGRRMHHIPVLLEADVTLARQRIRAQAGAGGARLSFTAWLIACVGRAVAEHPRVHALRQGSARLVCFDDVDVSVAVERRVDGGADQPGTDHHHIDQPSTVQPGAAPPETLPMPLVLRRTNRRSAWDLHRELRGAQQQPLEAGETQLGKQGRGRWVHLFLALPGPLRRGLLRATLLHNPIRMQRAMGTVALTSVGMFGGAGGSAWPLPAGVHPLIVGVGTIARKPGYAPDAPQGPPQPRELLALTVLFDHDVVDGAPVARFLARLRDLLESAWGVTPEPGPPASAGA